MKVQQFLFQQMLRDAEEGARGQINFPQFIERSKNNWNLIREEDAEAARQGLEDFKQASRLEAEVIASRKIERALSILGTLSTTSPTTRNYILNGRHIICRDQGVYTICN
jgi:biopolymer transport protein ExbB/TolQ